MRIGQVTGESMLSVQFQPGQLKLRKIKTINQLFSLRYDGIVLLEVERFAAMLQAVV